MQRSGYRALTGPSLLALLAAACSSGSPAATSPTAGAAPAPSIQTRLRPCRPPGASEDFLCGKYRVFEDRASRKGRTIDLDVVVVPATSRPPAPDPIFFFAGGPGAGVTREAPGWARNRSLRGRDLVFVDQRGTGGSNRLDCHLPRDREDWQGYFEPILPAAEVRRCRDDLEKIADLTLYTTAIAMDDVDEVRGWLGHDRINLMGASYGTRAAQVYMRRHGERVRSAVLVGVAALNQYSPLFHARDGKAAVDALFEDCRADAACAAAFPDLAAQYQRVLDRLDRERGRAAVKSPDGEAITVSIPRDSFAETTRMLLYDASLSAMAPYLIHRAARGDFAPIARLVLAAEPAYRGALAWGQNLSVTCAEDIPFVSPGAARAAIAGTYLRGYRIDQQIAACAAWPRAEVEPDFHRPLVSDIPTLLLSGRLDPVTPPRWAETVVPHLSRGRHLVLADGHHGAGGLSNPECWDRMIARFFDAGAAEGLDVSCLDTMESPPFAVDDAGFARAFADRVGG